MIQKIIYQYNDRDSLYGNKLTNHLNMGLYALFKMGATEERIHEFARTYTEKLKLPPLPRRAVEIDEYNFKDYLGIDGRYSSYIPFFESEMEQKGRDAVLRQYTDLLLQGEAGGAFHGLIRLSYALELNDDFETARALAYFAEAWSPFGISDEPGRGPEREEPLETIISLSKNSRFINFSFTRGLIIGRMKDVYDDPSFLSVIRKIPEEHCNSAYFSDLLVKLYLLTGDFTILHGVTSTHGLRLLEPYISDYAGALTYHWYMLQLAYLSTGCAALGEISERSPSLRWPEIFAEACKSDDVHTIKLVYSLSEQAKLSDSDELYRLAACDKIKK